MPGWLAAPTASSAHLGLQRAGAQHGVTPRAAASLHRAHRQDAWRCCLRTRLCSCSMRERMCLITEVFLPRRPLSSIICSARSRRRMLMTRAGFDAQARRCRAATAEPQDLLALAHHALAERALRAPAAGSPASSSPSRLTLATRPFCADTGITCVARQAEHLSRSRALALDLGLDLRGRAERVPHGVDLVEHHDARSRCRRPR